MRIAFLCKQRYMGKDVIADRYARLYEIPYQLARAGHELLGICLSYYPVQPGEWVHEAGAGPLRWISRSLPPPWIPALTAYPFRVLADLKAFGPDVVVSASDIPHMALGAWLAGRLRVPLVLDFYDNFESFGQARIPGMKSALQGAARRAALITTTSSLLADYVRESYQTRGEIMAMPSTVDRAVFKPLDRAVSRAALGLPANAQLIGTAGGLYRDKGIGTVYEAWRKLAAVDSNIHLVLAGPTDKRCPPPRDSRVHYLGMLEHSKVATLFSALDVGIIYLRDTDFGRYCFPQKAYEMLACGLPVVAGKVGATAELFATTPQALYEPDDAAQLARTIRGQLDQPARPEVSIQDWAQIIGTLERRLVDVVKDHRGRHTPPLGPTAKHKRQR